MPDDTSKPFQLEPNDLFTSFGSTGLNTVGGFVAEEWHRKLSGQNGIRVYREIADNDDVVGAMLFAFEMLIRSATWRVEPAGEDDKSIEAAEFVDSCIIDMSHTFDSWISEIITMTPYGFSYFETVYKQRIGPDQEDPAKRSQFKDGRIGWRKQSIRSQETIYKWAFDEDGGIRGAWQKTTTGQMVFLPIEKCLLFRTKETKNNPEGRSLLRNVYRSWFFKKRIQEIEAIGIERDLAGLPVAYMPAEFMTQSASADEKALKAMFQDLVQKIRRDEYEGIVFPSPIDVAGNPTGFDLKLLSSGGKRQIDASSVIERYDKRIAATLLHDWILMGQDAVGSFALSSSKTQMSSLAVQTILESIKSVINRIAIYRLMRLNPEFKQEVWPELTYSDIEVPPLNELADFVNKLVGASVLTPDATLERKLRDIGGLPEPDDEPYETNDPVVTEDDEDAGPNS
jgi:hypothetical protein